MAKGKVVRKGTNNHGIPRKFIEIRGLDYDDFDFGDIVRIEKIGKSQQQS